MCLCFCQQIKDAVALCELFAWLEKEVLYFFCFVFFNLNFMHASLEFSILASIQLKSSYSTKSQQFPCIVRERPSIQIFTYSRKHTFHFFFHCECRNAMVTWHFVMSFNVFLVVSLLSFTCVGFCNFTDSKRQRDWDICCW